MRLLFVSIACVVLAAPLGAAYMPDPNTQIATLGADATPVKDAPVVEGARENSGDKLFSMEVPAGWEVARDTDQSSLAVISPRESADDGFRENVLLASFSLKKTMTLSEYYNNNVYYLQQKIPDMKIVKSEADAIDGGEAIRVIYTSTMEGARYTTIQVFVMKDSRAYIITCMAQEDNFDNFEPLFDKIISSFRFEKQ